MGRVWKNFEVYYRKSLYRIKEIVDRNVNVKDDFSEGSDGNEEHN